MSFTYDNKIRVSIFGQSHSEKMGVVIEGIPSGFEIDEEKLSLFMARRAPGHDEFSTPRKESDKVEFISGLKDKKTCGAPLCAVIENKNTISKDYNNLSDIPRPSHADFAAWAKYGDARDYSGGGQFSGRLTAPLCVAGGILMQYYEKKGIYIGAHIASIGALEDILFDKTNVTKADFVSYKDFPVLSDKMGEEMKEEIRRAKKEGDSVGGTVECAIVGLPAGLG